MAWTSEGDAAETATREAEKRNERRRPEGGGKERELARRDFSSIKIEICPGERSGKEIRRKITKREEERFLRRAILLTGKRITIIEGRYEGDLEGKTTLYHRNCQWQKAPN